MANNAKKKRTIKALIGATIIGIASWIGIKLGIGIIESSKVSKDKDTKTISDTNTDTNENGIANLDTLGIQESLYAENPGEYVDASEGINAKEVTKGADGDLYVNEEAAKASVNVGKSEIDTKGGTLTVTPSGKVVEKDQQTVITYQNGETVTGKSAKNIIANDYHEVGTNEEGQKEYIPNGYVTDGNGVTAEKNKDIKNDVVAPENSEVGTVVSSEVIEETITETEIEMTYEEIREQVITQLRASNTVPEEFIEETADEIMKNMGYKKPKTKTLK